MSEEEKRSEELFINFVIMMSQSVMLQLGKIANPVSGKIEKSLEGARATIDLLIVLKEKTKGNLDEREEKFFATTLSALQMNYVDEKKKEPSPDSGQDPSTSSGQEEKT